MSNNGHVAVKVGAAAVAVAGVSTAAAGTAAVIAATGGAAAVVLVGYGIYRWLSKDDTSKITDNQFKKHDHHQ